MMLVSATSEATRLAQIDVGVDELASGLTPWAFTSAASMMLFYFGSSQILSTFALTGFLLGADISDQCITFRDGLEHRKILPRKSGSYHHDTLYMVRLWLCKPPLQIYHTIGH